MKSLSRIVLILFLLQVALFFLSWILYVLGISVNSLLSAAGLRWFFGTYISNFLSPVLAWIILLSIAYGSFRQANFKWEPSGYRNRIAWRVVGILFCLIIIVIFLLTAIPHAILLSIIGTLFPSPFALSILPIIAFSVVLLSMAYGFITGSIDGLSSACRSMIDGLSSGAPLLILYVFIVELFYSYQYVFE